MADKTLVFETSREERTIIKNAQKNKDLNEDGMQSILNHVHNNAIARAKRKVK